MDEKESSYHTGMSSKVPSNETSGDKQAAAKHQESIFRQNNTQESQPEASNGHFEIERRPTGAHLHREDFSEQKGYSCHYRQSEIAIMRECFPFVPKGLDKLLADQSHINAMRKSIRTPAIPLGTVTTLRHPQRE